MGSNDMSEPEIIRTPQQILAEFADEAASILSGGNARSDKDLLWGGEAKTKFPRHQSAVTRGRGHSGWACTDGRSL